MRKIRDYICKVTEDSGIDRRITDRYGLEFPKAYEESRFLSVISSETRKLNDDLYCTLPFCHTAEAEAMGADIVPGDGNTGPRAGKYCCSELCEVLKLDDIDFKNGRIREILDSAAYMSGRGEKVMLEISGPFTILNSIIDPVKVYRSLMKDEDVLTEVFEKIRKNLLEYIGEALQAGVKVISYADSSGSVSILGPRLSKKAALLFTLPFLKDVENMMPENAVIHLCPKTVQMLISLDMAEFQDFKVNRKLSYEESVEFYRISEHDTPFLGQMCINNKKQIMKVGKIMAVKLL